MANTTNNKIEIKQVLLKVKISKSLKNRGIDAGIPHHFETKAELKKKAKKNAEQVGKKKAYRLDRIDTAGLKVTDAGNLIFHYKKDGKEENITPMKAIADLFMKKLKLSEIEIYEKEGDRTKMGFLCMQFSVEKASFGKLSKEATKFVDFIMKRTYRACYGYINPASDEDPINTTFNLSGPIVDQKEIDEKLPLFKDLRIVNMTHPGHAKCIKKTDAQKTVAA